MKTVHVLEPIHVERLNGCARCHGEGHDDLTFEPLIHPFEVDEKIIVTHWAPCPTNGQPILLSVLE